MAHINLSTITTRLASMKRADNEWANIYVRDVSHLLRLLERARADERERAAKIAECAFEPAHTYASENAHEYRIFDNGQRRAIKKIAAAIRGEAGEQG